MKNFLAASIPAKHSMIVSATAAGFAAVLLGLAAPAAAAPSGSGNAAETISALVAEGNRVIVTRQGSTDLADANVVGVRRGLPVRDYVWDAQGDDRILKVTGHVVFVDVE